MVSEAGLDHLEHAGLTRTPVAVYADRHWMVGLSTKQLDDRAGNRLVVQQIDFGFVIGQNHSSPPCSSSIASTLL
ncbi:hypothetical protein D9M68_866430 [compost metagenome]